MTRRRLFLVVVIVVAGLVVVAMAAFHAASVQRRLFDRVSAMIEDRTGWTVELAEPRLELWPARFTAAGATASIDGVAVASTGRLEVRWGWTAVIGSPRRVEFVSVDSIVIDLRDPPRFPEIRGPATDSGADPWRAVEIARLEISGGRGAAGWMDVAGTLDGLGVDASLIDGVAALDIEVDGAVLDRFGRKLDLGRVEVRAAASEAWVKIEDLVAAGGEVSCRVEAEVTVSDGVSASAKFALGADIRRTLEWWDPNLMTGFEPFGSVALEGRAMLSEDGGLEVTADHVGDPFRAAGYRVDGLALAYDRGVVRVEATGREWGQAAVSVDETALATVHARLRNAPVSDLLAFSAPGAAAVLGRPVTLSGEIDATVAFPVVVDTLSGRVDVDVVSPRGRARVVARGKGLDWSVSTARVLAGGVSAVGSGRLRSGGAVNAEIDLDIDDPSQVAAWMTEYFPDLSEIGVGGGPLSGHAKLAGSLDHPVISADLEWSGPEILGRRLQAATATADGVLDGLDWSARIIVDTGSEVTAGGSFDPTALRGEGNWDFKIDELRRFAGWAELAPEVAEGLAGNLTGSGTFAVDRDRWSLEGGVEGANVGFGAWQIDRLQLAFDVDNDRLNLNSAIVSAFGGTASGSAAVGIKGLDSGLVADVEWDGLDLNLAPAELSWFDDGFTDGSLDLAGTVSRPTGEVEVLWRPSTDAAGIPDVRAAGTLDDGVLRLVTEQVSTDAGAFVAEGEVPLGLLPLPEWLWPEAPERAVRITARGQGLRSETVTNRLGIEDPPVSATGDLELELSWDPNTPDDTRILAELRDLHLSHIGGEIVADGPLTVHVAGTEVEIEPIVLTGPQTRIELSGSADLETGRLTGVVDAVMAPSIARLIPYPVQIHNPIRMSAEIGGTAERPRVKLSVDHSGGALVFRDPPVQIVDLVVTGDVVDGALWIKDGRALINGGAVELGGGWDPVSGQGLVADFDDVVVYFAGILSQWSGAIAVEPDPDTDRLARLVGEINLVAGLWDQNVSLGAAIFGGSTLERSSDDPLNAITLDLDVRGRGLVRVENNLGRFDARWDVLRVTGTAARPRINGEIEIAPGGRFSLAGQRVTVRRGGLVFTGNPQLDPIVEIVPESDVAVFGSGEGQVDTAALATQSLVEGLAGALGFENETLQPAEISVEVERDASQQLMLGQRLSNSIALFFATNTTDVQDRTSMLQLWNLPGLKGLALQGYEKTLTEEVGGNVIQRFQWGGSSLFEDRPTISKLRLEGEWPQAVLGTWPFKGRRLKRATGIRRGQPFDSFLPFVAKVRMERELAGAGYQEAQVSVEANESNNAWTLVFECEPGPRQEIRFEGDVPPRAIREEVTALYQPPPLERVGFRNMRSLLDRHFDAEGYPNASIVVERRDDLVVAEVSRQGLTELSGPFLEGVPDPVAATLRQRLGTPSELARLAADEANAAGVIENQLRDQGYHQSRVLSVETVAVSAERAEIRGVVDLGSQAVVGELVVTGSDPLGLTGADGFSLAVGSPLDRASVDLSASRLRAAYDAAGYSDATVRGSAVEAPEGGWIVTVHIDPGIQRTFEGVEVSGLHHTSRRAVVSGIELEEGEVLRNSDLDTAAVRIANFSPIERVDVRTIPQGSTGAKVELEVVEKPRWTTEVGGGWSSERGVQARFGARDDNLFGRGFSLNFRGRWDRTEWLGFVVASLPPLPGDRISFTSTVGFLRGDSPRDPDKLLQDEASWSLESTYWLGSDSRIRSQSGEQITAYYRYVRTHTYEKEPDPDGFFPIDITTKIGLLGARYVRDRFDYPFDPKSGHGLIIDVASSKDFLGSDLDYWTALGTASLATEVLGSSTWIQSLRVGVAEPLGGSELTAEAKFFAGGQGSVRGFDRNTVGPVAPSVGEGFSPAGGGALFILNEELRIRVRGGLRAAVFADVGQVWESWGEADFNLSVGAGVGIRWATPVGPLWADVAWPLVNTGISSTKPKFYVGIGRPF